MKLFILCQCNGIAITQSIDCVRQVPLGSKSVCPDSILIRAPRVTLGTGHRKAWFVITASIRHYSFKSDSRPHRPSLLVAVDRSFQNTNCSYSVRVRVSSWWWGPQDRRSTTKFHFSTGASLSLSLLLFFRPFSAWVWKLCHQAAGGSNWIFALHNGSVGPSVFSLLNLGPGPFCFNRTG